MPKEASAAGILARFGLTAQADDGGGSSPSQIGFGGGWNMTLSRGEAKCSGRGGGLYMLSLSSCERPDDGGEPAARWKGDPRAFGGDCGAGKEGGDFCDGVGSCGVPAPHSLVFNPHEAPHPVRLPRRAPEVAGGEFGGEATSTVGTLGRFQASSATAVRFERALASVAAVSLDVKASA